MSSISSDIIVLDSRQKQALSTNQAAVYSLLNVGGIGSGTYEMLSYHSVNQMYNVEVGVNDSVLFDEGVGLVTGTIAPGAYATRTALLTGITDAMGAAGTQTYGTSTYNALLGLYTFIPVGGITTLGFSFGGSPAASAHRLLGMADVTVAPVAANVTSVNVVDDRLHSNIFVTILEEGNKHVTTLVGSEHSLMVPLNTVFNEAIHHRKQEHYQQTLTFPTNISTINVTLTTQDGIALVNAPDYIMSLRKLF